MRNTDDTMAFLRQQHSNGSTAWRGMCLSLQRQARGLPAVYPSAIAAQEATPKSYRVYDAKNVKRGMVAYFDDPNDSNEFGHITGVAGRDEDGTLLHWTNDAVPGRVSLVRHDFFSKYWGDSFKFAATWLNGYVLDMPNKRTPAPPISDGAPALRRAVKHLEKAIKNHEEQGHPKLVRALKRDRVRLLQTIDNFDGDK